LAQTLARIAFQQRDVFVLGHSERVMTGIPAFAFLVVFEHREVHHPQRFPSLAVDVTLFVSDLAAQRAQRVVDDFLLSAPKKMMSPFAAPVRSMMVRSAASWRFFTMGDCRPVSFGCVMSLILM